MRTFGILVLIGVLGMPLVATAQESAQQPSQRLTWSMGGGQPHHWRMGAANVSGTTHAVNETDVGGDRISNGGRPDVPLLPVGEDLPGRASALVVGWSQRNGHCYRRASHDGLV